ncbi:MAG TPA: TIGR00300 family protein [Candidatus Eisenbacteria bacterium]|jgi:lysine-ketoglutarate reductase/saccharopine dehydrogenase-like protein (TIGR00300 family)
MLRENVTMEGHLIDSDILRRVFGRIVEEGGQFEVLEFRVGKTNAEPSFARLAVLAPRPEVLDRILEGLNYLGASAVVEDARFAPAEADGIVPDDFYSTANFETFVRVGSRWQPVLDQKMDCVVVLRDGSPRCVKQGQVRSGEPVVLRGPGIRVHPPERSRDYSVFGFMSNEISAEVNKGIAITGIAREMRRIRDAGEKIAAVVGPAVVHSGGDGPLARLTREGWVDVLLSGNAFAVHDLEKAILRTSLGVCQMSGHGVEGGSRNHLYAINAVNRAGGIGPAVASGLVTSGVMYEAVRRGIPFVLAGSIRDDGPLRDVVTDSLAAQKAYAEALRGVGMCLMLATALHAIAVGNLLPARVRTVCVDMEESLPVKLSNRGSMQAVGLVTDVGFFLERLEAELRG